MTTEERVVTAQGTGAADAGVAGATGAATGGVAGSGVVGTPSQEPGNPSVVPVEDFRRLQATLNRQADAARREAEMTRQAYLQMQQEIAMRDQALQAHRQEILRLRTAGLPEDEAQAERLKDEREQLIQRQQVMEQQYRAALQTREQQLALVNEAKAREDTIRLFLNGGVTATGRKIEGYGRYGLTAAELNDCRTPYEMDELAAQKKEAYFNKKQAELDRKEASLGADKAKEGGARQFDRGEPTSGGTVRPRPGTPEFREYFAGVKAGKIKLRP